MSFWVYILRCADNSYYTGHTDNLEKCIGEHETGAIPSCYTFSRRPLELVFSQNCATREEALAAERQVKGWSRKKKEAMMRSDWEEVSRLAKPRTRCATANSELVEEYVVPSPTPTVRPERVEGRNVAEGRPSEQNGDQFMPTQAVRAVPVHPSTSSGRTEGGVAR